MIRFCPDEMVTTGYNYVTLRVENPLGLVISRPLRTVAGSAYWRKDADDNNVLDESAYDYNLQYGEYRVVITPRTNLPTGPVFSIGIRIDGTAENSAFRQYSVPPPGDSLVFYYQVEPVSSIYPANARPTANPQPTFNWSGLAGKARAADSYEFQLDRYYDFQFADLQCDRSDFAPVPYPILAGSGFGVLLADPSCHGGNSR